MPEAPVQNADTPSDTMAEKTAAASLPSAIILCFAGGVLDAFLYLDHGHVFAGAMTGNTVLFGIALLSHNTLNIVHHALPILAFLCGAWLAEILQGRLKHHATTVALAAEALGLLIASLLPHSFPDQAYVFLIAFVAAFQVASFRQADQFTYASTFITGDMRTFIVGLYESSQPGKRAQSLRKARDLGLAILAFLLGAVVSAWLSPRLGNHTLWIALAALLGVFAIALRRSVSTERDPPDQNA